MCAQERKDRIRDLRHNAKYAYVMTDDCKTRTCGAGNNMIQHLLRKSVEMRENEK